MTRSRIILDIIRREGDVTLPRLAMLCEYTDVEIANTVRNLVQKGNIVGCGWERSGRKPWRVYRFARALNPVGIHLGGE